MSCLPPAPAPRGGRAYMMQSAPPPPPMGGMPLMKSAPPPPPSAMAMDLFMADETSAILCASMGRMEEEENEDELMRELMELERESEVPTRGAPLSPPLLPPPKDKAAGSLTDLITAQQVNGSWNLNSALAQQVDKSLSDLESACPAECKGAVASVWATVLAVSLLRARYSSQQDEWELIAMKAESWLKKQSLPSGLTLEQLFQAAQKIM